MKLRKYVMRVDGHATRFKVVRRNCQAWEPCCCVVREGSGANAEVVAHFYCEDDAEKYAKWRSKSIKRG